jgi:hypothetical protein
MTEKEKRDFMQVLTVNTILKLLDWEVSEFANFQMEQGLKFAGRLMGKKVDACNQIFWGWWVVKWMQADRDFLDLVDSFSTEELPEYYKALHDADTFEFIPSKGLYSKMVFYQKEK